MILEDLAIMVAKGFESVDKRFGGIESRMATKEDIHELKQKVSRIDFRVDEMHDILMHFEENDLLNLQRRVKTLERIIKAMAKKIS